MGVGTVAMLDFHFHNIRLIKQHAQHYFLRTSADVDSPQKKNLNKLADKLHLGARQYDVLRYTAVIVVVFCGCLTQQTLPKDTDATTYTENEQ